MSRKRRRTRPARLLALSLGMWACQSKPVRVDIPVPPMARSMVIGLDDGRSLQVVAARVDRPMNLPGVAAYAGHAHLTAIAYDRDLEALDVPEGPLAPIQPSSTDVGIARQLPRPADQVMEADVNEDRVAGWAKPSTAAGDLGSLSTFHYRGTKNLCVGWSSTLIEGPIPSDDYQILLRLDDRSALAAGLSASNWVIVTRDGATKTSSIGGFLALTGYATPSGEVWLAGDQGRLYAGRPGAFSLKTQSPRRGRIRWMAGPTDASPFELFTLSAEGDLERFDGMKWELLGTHPSSPADKRGAIAWLGPGEAVALPPQPEALEDELLHYASQKTPPLSSSFFPSGEFGKINALTGVPGVGAVAVTRFGFMVSVKDGVYHSFGSAQQVDDPRAFTAFRDGALAGGKGLELAQYSKAIGGLCPTVSVMAIVQPCAFAPNAGGLLVSGNTDVNVGAFVALDPMP